MWEGFLSCRDFTTDPSVRGFGRLDSPSVLVPNHKCMSFSRTQQCRWVESCQEGRGAAERRSETTRGSGRIARTIGPDDVRKIKRGLRRRKKSTQTITRYGVDKPWVVAGEDVLRGLLFFIVCSGDSPVLSTMVRIQVFLSWVRGTKTEFRKKKMWKFYSNTKDSGRHLILIPLLDNGSWGFQVLHWQLGSHRSFPCLSDILHLCSWVLSPVTSGTISVRLLKCMESCSISVVLKWDLIYARSVDLLQFNLSWISPSHYTHHKKLKLVRFTNSQKYEFLSLNRWILNKYSRDLLIDDKI